MKKTLQLLCISCLLAACNDTSVENQVTQTQTPVQEKEMKDAIAKYPDSIPLRKLLIKYYENNQSAELAMKEVDNAIKIDSNDATLWDKKASIYIYNEDTLSAIKAYNKAIAIYPDPEYIMSVGMLYAFNKNDTALAMADAMLISSKANAEKEALLIKGVYYKTKNDKQKAIDFFDQSIKSNYSFIAAYLQKGITLYELGKYDESIKVFERATTLQNNFSEGYYWMGMCYEKLKNTDAAIENYRLAVQYDPDYTDAKDALGKLGVK